MRHLTPSFILAPSADIPPASELYGAFTKSVDGAQAELRNYETLLEKGNYKQIIERVNKSRKENPLGIIPWDATEHPDWYEVTLSTNMRT